jgi:hypothetical protein
VQDTVTLTNVSPDPVTVDVSAAQVWLDTSLSGSAVIAGGSSASFAVVANPTGLSGTMAGELDIADSASADSQTVPVSLAIHAGSTPGGGKKGGCALGDGGDSALWLLLLTAIATLTLSLRAQKLPDVHKPATRANARPKN